MSHKQHVESGEIMSNCGQCRAELKQLVSDEEFNRIMIEAAKRDEAANAAFEKLDLEAINEFLVREEAQWFLAVENLEMASRPTVWMRMLAADFMSEAHVVPRGRKRRVRVTATGKTIQECLENLASAVAARLYPVAPPGATESP